MSVADLIPDRGAIVSPLRLEVVRRLERSDLLRLAAEGAAGASPPPLQRIRAIHHRQALLLAEGKTLRQVAAICGTTPQRLTQLQKDPAFRELMAVYTDSIVQAQLEDTLRVKHKLTDLSEMAVDELRDRFEDDKKRAAMSIDAVTRVATFAADRSVAPPKAVTSASVVPQNITLSFGTSLRPEAPPVIEAKDLGTSLPAPREEHSLEGQGDKITIDLVPEEKADA